MALTGKQEAFAQAVASGMTQADAYRSSYDCEGSANTTIIENASRTMADSNVAARVAELKEAIAIAAIWTRLDSVRTLADIAVDGEARANEKVSAVKELNAMHGFNAPTKHEVAGNFTLNINFD
jgi:hypothetical protein